MSLSLENLYKCKQVACKVVVFSYSTLLLLVYFFMLLYYTDVVAYVIVQYKPSVRIIDLVAHSTYVVCVNFLFIHKWRGTYSLKSTSDDRFF